MIDQESPLKAPAGAGRQGQRWQALAVCLALAAITFAIFGRTLTHEFIDYDDKEYVFENPVVAQGLTFKGIAWAFSCHASNWHPLTWLSHMLDCQLYGLHPGGHHLTNVLLHAATVIALFLVLRQMTGAFWRSAFVAAVFAIHPLRVESVAWVAERKDVLSGLFFMLTIGAYVRYARRPWSPARYGLVMLLFVMGLMCKPMLVTLPVVLLLLDYWPLQRVETRKFSGLLTEKLPLLALSAAACGTTFLAQAEAIQSTVSYPVPLRLPNALVSCMVYLGQMFWPAGLAIFYPYSHNGLPLWEAALAGTLLAGLSAIAWVQRQRQPWLLVGWVWYLVMLLPVVGIIQVGNQARADRYTYLPQIGICIAVTWLAGEWAAKWRVGQAAIASLMAALLAVLMVSAWKQTSYWKDGVTLWTRALACTTGNSTARLNLAADLRNEGKVAEAIVVYQQGLQDDPDDADLHTSLSDALLETGKVDDAITQCERALQIMPNDAEACLNLGNALLRKGRVDDAIGQYQKALQIDPAFAMAHNNLGTLLLQKGGVDDAVTEYHKALQLKPNAAEFHNNLGKALLQKKSVDDAIAEYEKALQLKPVFAEAHFNLGNALRQKGRLDEAITHYRSSLQLRPDYPEALLRLGNVLLQTGQADEAVAPYQKALAIDPNNAGIHLNLGLCFFRLGRMDEAIAQYQEALQIEPADARVQNNLAWLLATCPQASLRNGGQAVELARQANAMTGGENPSILHTLAAAFAEAGRFSEAVETAQHALRLAGEQSDTRLTAQLQSELQLYQAGSPFHSAAQKH